jgi:hypothetical protein
LSTVASATALGIEHRAVGAAVVGSAAPMLFNVERLDRGFVAPARCAGTSM